MAQDPYRYFRIEARDLTEQIVGGVVALERAGDPAAVARLLRLAHTLKGAARVVRQARVAELAHAIEDGLAPFRDSADPLPREVAQELLRAVDDVTAQVAGLTPQPESGAPRRPEEEYRTLRAEVADVDALLAGVGQAQLQLSALRDAADTLVGPRRLARAAALRGSDPALDGDGGADELGRVLTDLDRTLATELERIERELEQVRGAAERLRLLPADVLFPSLERVTRDVAGDLGRRAVFDGQGGDVRIDGHVLAAVQTALIQAVRNALAHGLEPEGERRTAGKPPEGRVRLSVERRGGRVAFTCVDDGRGIDVRAVREAMERRGGPLPEDAGPEEILRQLMARGVTTSRSVTEAAGRGLGLDIVREVADRLGGQAALRSRAGGGTELELLVPVSLSSLDAVLVEAGGITAAIPVEAVRGAARVEQPAARSPAAPTVAHAGGALPVTPLAPLLGREPPAAPHRLALVVGGGAGTVAFGVDRLLGCQTVVVRPLPALASVDPVVCGLAADSAGRSQLVLDPERLVRNGRLAPRPPAALPPAARPILVVDDSLTTRMLEQSILESAGYQVELASSGEEALEKARARRYGLLLVDVEMPGMDGFTLLERMRGDPELREIPALLVTSRHAPEDRARGLRAGARAYIVKSEFDQIELLETIRSLSR